MPEYNYECNDCKKRLEAADLSIPDTIDLGEKGILELDSETTRVLMAQVYEEEVLFVTSHSMNPSEKELAEALICPRCDSNDVTKSFHGNKIHGYVRGYGYLDKAGAKRDMNVFHLTQDDPYAELREAGEVDDLKTRLERGGQHDPNTKYFVSKKAMEKAVSDSVSSSGG